MWNVTPVTYTNGSASGLFGFVFFFLLIQLFIFTVCNRPWHMIGQVFPLFHNLLFNVNFRIEHHKISLQHFIRITLNVWINLRSSAVFTILNCLSHVHYLSLLLFSFLLCPSMIYNFFHEDFTHSLLDFVSIYLLFLVLIIKGIFQYISFSVC